jgi:hypothetical protein
MYLVPGHRDVPSQRSRRQEHATVADAIGVADAAGHRGSCCLEGEGTHFEAQKQRNYTQDNTAAGSNAVN